MNEPATPNALRFGVGHGDAEGAHQFAKSHHLEVLVHEDKIKGKQHSDGVDSVGGHNPSPPANQETEFSCPAGRSACPDGVF